MNRVAAYAIVLIAAATPWLEVLLVVPAAILAGLSPPLVALIAAIGNIATLLPVIYAGDRLRSWLQRRRARRGASGSSSVAPTAEADGTSEMTDEAESAEQVAAPRGKQGRGRRLFDRYGLPGLALLGPLLTGIHVAAAVAVAAGAPRRPTTWWLSAGVVLWSVLAAVVTVLGLDLFVDPDALPDLFGGQSTS